jgi:glutamate-1-semialdehyde 2,1-aminomutase
MGCVIPTPEFLTALRDLTTRNGALLVCDEVMTGFRVAYGGAQEVLKQAADITVLGTPMAAPMAPSPIINPPAT